MRMKVILQSTFVTAGGVVYAPCIWFGKHYAIKLATVTPAGTIAPYK